MEVIEVLRDILKTKYQITANIDENTNLIDELGFDSIVMLELASDLEKKLAVEINNAFVGSWNTVKSIVDSINN